METRLYEPPVEDAIAIILEYLSNLGLGFWYSYAVLAVHIHRHNDYVGMVCLPNVLGGDTTKVKVVRFSYRASRIDLLQHEEARNTRRLTPLTCTTLTACPT
jgi:hypothetical protein